MAIVTDTALDAIRSQAVPIAGAAGDYDSLLDLVGNARFVLLGEATHGTHEFYAERARITQRLIEEKGFTAVAVEADWPDAYRVNRYVRGEGQDADGRAALGGFERFPAWMWRNTAVLDFVEWLRARNDATAQAKAGFYGLDLYSLFTSIHEVLAYLDKVDPVAARASPMWELCSQTTMRAGLPSRDRWRASASRVSAMWLSRRFHDDTRPRNMVR